jgi:ribosomal protein L23
MDKAVVLKPRLSEKAYALSEERNTYVFAVPAKISRLSIAKAIIAQYGVGVESVKIASQPGKTRRTYRRRGRVVHRGQVSGMRKAYVRLKEGDKLPIFSAVDEKKKAKEEEDK